MDDLEKGAKGSDSPSGDKSGANGAGSPPAEQVIAEFKRKSEEMAKFFDEFKEFKNQFGEVVGKIGNLSQPKDDKADKVVADRKTLAAKMRRQAEGGDVSAQAWLAIAEEVADAKFEARMKEDRDNQTKREREQDFEARDKMLEDEAKAAGVSTEEFKNMIDSYAKHYPESIYKPTDQLKMTVALWKKEKEIMDGKREIDEFRQKNQNFRDGGTGNEAGLKSGGDKKGLSGWRDAKTEKDKEGALAFI